MMTTMSLICPPLFDDAADQPSPSIESVTRTELIGLHQADPDRKHLLDLVGKEEHPYSLRSGTRGDRLPEGCRKQAAVARESLGAR